MRAIYLAVVHGREVTDLVVSAADCVHAHVHIRAPTRAERKCHNAKETRHSHPNQNKQNNNTFSLITAIHLSIRLAIGTKYNIKTQKIFSLYCS